MLTAGQRGSEGKVNIGHAVAGNLGDTAEIHAAHGFSSLTGLHRLPSFRNLSRPSRGPGSVETMPDPSATSLGLPGGTQTETDSGTATPSKGLVGQFQTPN